MLDVILLRFSPLIYYLTIQPIVIFPLPDYIHSMINRLSGTSADFNRQTLTNGLNHELKSLKLQFQHYKEVFEANQRSNQDNLHTITQEIFTDARWHCEWYLEAIERIQVFASRSANPEVKQIREEHHITDPRFMVGDSQVTYLSLYGKLIKLYDLSCHSMTDRWKARMKAETDKIRGEIGNYVNLCSRHDTFSDQSRH